MKQAAVDWSNKKVAFTLAEVLITLGIIGIVAALTLPTLIQNHRNQVVETRLKHFYSTINQAITLAELDYGERENWHNLNDVDTDKNGNPVKGQNPREKWLYKYIVPYMQTVKSNVLTDNYGKPVLYFNNGSALMMRHSTSLDDWGFYPGSYEKCSKSEKNPSTCSFTFYYHPAYNLKYVGRRFEPYKWGWNGDIKRLERACINNEKIHGDIRPRDYCTAFIQSNGWKIPKNYPFKVTY